jgi:long-chain acyl-CoA synthetase
MVMELLYAHAEADPGPTALVHGDERLSRAELVDRVERTARGLAARGIGPGDAVALVLPNDPVFVAGLLAVTGLGAVAVPLSRQLMPDELEFAFRACRVRAVVADEQSAGRCKRALARIEEPAQLLTAAAMTRLIERHAPARLAPRAPGEPFVYQFSSGSTGRPKRVERTHAQLRAEADSYDWITSADGLFCAIPLFHTYGMGCCLLAAVRSGGALVLLEEPSPFALRRQRALELIERERPTVFPGVPFNFRLLADAPGHADLSSLRLCFSAGTALPRPAFDAFMARFGIPVRQLYGCTEAGTLTANLDGDPVATFESVGTPVGDVRVAVDDETGEVAVSSPAMTRGYSDLDEVNRDAFRGGWFRTGDLGRLDGAGRLYVTGRMKLLIEVAGHKVDPIEVEDVLAAHPGVREAVVVGVRRSGELEESVKAVVVPSNGCREREVIEFCRERLASFKVPRVVEFRDEIPRSPLGKVLRKYLV